MSKSKSKNFNIVEILDRDLKPKKYKDKDFNIVETDDNSTDTDVELKNMDANNKPIIEGVGIIDILNKNFNDKTELRSIDRRLDLIIDALGNSVIARDFSYINNLIGELPLEVINAYEDLNINSDAKLKQSYYLGILQAFTTISMVLSRKIEDYQDIIDLGNKDNNLYKVLSILTKCPKSENRIKELGVDIEDIVQKYKEQNFVDFIDSMGNKVYMLTKQGWDAYFVLTKIISIDKGRK